MIYNQNMQRFLKTKIGKEFLKINNMKANDLVKKSRTV